VNISVFSDYNRFSGSSLADSEDVSLLDFNNEAQLRKERAHQLLKPVHLTSNERIQLMDDFVASIAELGTLNAFSLYWLCHPISEKNELLPGNLFDSVKDYLSFLHVIKQFKGTQLAVISVDTVLSAAINEYAGKSNKKGVLSPLRHFLSGIRMQVNILNQKRKRATKWQHLADTFNPKKTYTILRSWFDHRSWHQIANDKDTYYGKLPGFIKRNGQDILYYGDIIGAGFEPKKSDEADKSLPPILMEGQFLRAGDVFHALLFQLICRFKIKLKKKITLHDNDVSSIYKHYYKKELNGYAIFNNYFTFLAAKRMIKKVKSRLFLNLFENYSWEKVTTLALRKSSKPMAIHAFQHAQVAANSVKFAMAKDEAIGTPLPDKIITLGEVTRNFLVQQRHYPESITVTGCALRHDYHIPETTIPKKRQKHIHVYMWTFERSIEMLNFLYQCRHQLEDYSLSVRMHPINPLEQIKPHLDFTDMSFFKISTGSLVDSFQEADIALYSGTTVCLDALANGLPVINIQFDDFISPDPIADFNDFKWTVTTGQELFSAIKTITELDDQTFYQLQKKGLDFVNQYFYPVNNTNMTAFLVNK
jgi:hypothetical protein